LVVREVHRNSQTQTAWRSLKAVFFLLTTETELNMWKIIRTEEL